jgi:hypothetical protein
MSLIDRGAAVSSPRRARAFVRKAAKTLKRAAGLAVAAAARGKLSSTCGSALSGILFEAERRAEELAAAP